MNITEKRTQIILDYLQDKHYAEYCPHYGEPGYQDPDRGILFCDWNDVPKRIQDYLEEAGYALEWSDEWYIDYDNNKAWRTEPNGYDWIRSIMYTDNEVLTPDDGASAFIDECAVSSANQRIQALPAWITADDLLSAGFELEQTGLESGYFPGQTGDPTAIAKKLLNDATIEQVLFQRTENSQFYTQFSVWIKRQEDNEE